MQRNEKKVYQSMFFYKKILKMQKKHLKRHTTVYVPELVL